MMKMGNLFNRILVIGIVTIVSCVPALAEYVVYKTTKNIITRTTSLKEPTPQEFKTAYDIIIKYQWPTSIYTFYSEPNINLQQDEETSIRQELHKAFPIGNIEIAFIPTIIYEAAFLGLTVVPGEVTQDAQEILMQILGDNQWGRIIDQKVLAVLKTVQDKDEKTQYLAILKYMYELNMHEKTISIAQSVNQKICATLNKDFDFIRTMNLESAPPQKQMVRSKVTQIKHFILGNPRPSWNLSAAISKYFEEYDNPKASWNDLLNKRIIRSVMIDVAKLEVQAHRQNQALIFRGSGQDSPLRLKDTKLYGQLKTPEMQQRENILRGKAPSISEKDITPFSLSYGFSLMAGMAIETGGNVYNYTLGGGLGYALKIDKKLFFDRNRKSPRNLFWVPPFGTIFSFYGIDDLFHPRSKVGMVESLKGIKFEPDDYVYIKGMRVTGKVSVDQFFSFSPIVWVVGVDKEIAWNGKVAALADYISSHAVPFYDPQNKIKEGRDILNTIHSDLLFLKEHQSKFTNALAQIQNNPRALKDAPQKPVVPPRTSKPTLPTTKPGQERPLPRAPIMTEEQKKQRELLKQRPVPKGPMIQPSTNPETSPAA